MFGERYIPTEAFEGKAPQQDAWRKEVSAEVEQVEDAFASVLETGPVYEVKTRTGNPLRCETFNLDLASAQAAGVGGIDASRDEDETARAYLVARDTSGELVGTRVSSLFVGEKSIDVYSLIKVIKKGEGNARPIEEAFQRQLQDLANTYKKPVVWRVTNDNLQKLEQRRIDPTVDTQTLHALEEEQRRWQALYGPGGTLGIENGKKTFLPVE